MEWEGDGKSDMGGFWDGVVGGWEEGQAGILGWGGRGMGRGTRGKKKNKFDSKLLAQSSVC